MKWVLGVIVISSVISIFFVLRWGIQPKTVQIIDLSRARSLSQVGEFARQTLDMAMDRNPLIVLALRSSDRQNSELVAGFANSSRVQLKVVTDRVPDWAALREDLAAGHPTLLVRAPDDVSGSSFFRQSLEKELKTKPVYFVAAEIRPDPACPSQRPEFNLDAHDFQACASASFYRKVAKKKLLKEPFLFAVERFGAQIFVLFLRAPR